MRERKRRSRPCRYCRRWFRPSHRVGERQYACGSAACQAHRQRENERDWRDRHPGYLARRREQLRALGERRSAPARNATPLAKQLVALEVIPAEAIRRGLRSAESNKLVSAQGTMLIGLVAGLQARDANKQIDLGPGACFHRGPRLLKEVMPP